MLAWAVITVVMSVLDASVWVFHADGLLKIIANAANLLTTPARLVLRALVGSNARIEPFWIIITNAGSWAVYLGCLWVMLAWTRACSNGEAGESEPVDPARRRFLLRSGLGAAGVGIAATPAHATLVAPWDLHIDQRTIGIRDLPPAFEGLRLLQVSDTHLGPRVPRSFLDSVVQAGVGLRPDVLLLTGDYVSISDRFIDEGIELFRPLVEAARLGSLGVLGNHDHWTDGPRISRLLSELGVCVIDNDRVFLGDAGGWTDRPHPGALSIVGLGDLVSDEVLPGFAFRDVPETMPRIVLAHHPDTAELHSLTRPDAPRMDLMLSGHTHGGQVRLPFLGTPAVPSDYGSKYAGGLVQGPRCPVHVSRGVGMSILPIRFRVPPEINLITLTRSG